MCKKKEQVLDENGNKVKSKRLPGWAIALIVIALIIAIIGCTLLGVFWDIWFTEQTDSNLGQFYKTFGYSPVTTTVESDSIYVDYTDHFAQFSAEIERAMAPDATDEDQQITCHLLLMGCLPNGILEGEFPCTIHGCCHEPFARQHHRNTQADG